MEEILALADPNWFPKCHRPSFVKTDLQQREFRPKASNPASEWSKESRLATRYRRIKSGKYLPKKSLEQQSRAQEGGAVRKDLDNYDRCILMDQETYVKEDSILQCSVEVFRQRGPICRNKRSIRQSVPNSALLNAIGWLSKGTSRRKCRIISALIL